MRSLARETVFRFIFAKFFNPDDEGLFAVLLKDKELTDDDREFASQLLLAVESGRDKNIEKINAFAEKNSFRMVHVADKCALLIGMSELDNFPATPVPVVIDEAVKLAARYSTEKSTDFVNAILAECAKEKNIG